MDPFKKYVCHYCGVVLDFSKEEPVKINSNLWHNACVRKEMRRLEGITEQVEAKDGERRKHPKRNDPPR